MIAKETYSARILTFPAASAEVGRMQTESFSKSGGSKLVDALVPVDDRHQDLFHDLLVGAVL